MTTKNLVPRIGGEGSIGRSDKYWEKGFFLDIDAPATGINVTPAPGLTDTSVQAALATLSKSVVTLGTNITQVGNAGLPAAGGTLLGALQQPGPVTLGIISGSITLPTSSNRFIVNGAGSVLSITGFTGGIAEIRWNSVVTLVNSTSLILSTGGVNRVTAVGDIGYYGFDSIGVVREIGYCTLPVQGVLPGTIVSFLSRITPPGYLKVNGAAISRSTYATLIGSSMITISATGNKVTGNATILNVPTTVDMAIGMPIEGPGITAGATIASINSLTSITLTSVLTTTIIGGAFTVFPYGNGDGSTTANLPDLRGEHLRSFDDGRNVDSTFLYGNVTSGSNVVTGMTSTALLFVGMPVTGSYIAAGTTISGILSTSSITLSTLATGTAGFNLYFTGRRLGSWQDSENKSHNHTISYWGSSGDGSGSLFYHDSGTDWVSIDSTFSGNVEARGRNVAIPLYIKY